MHGAYKGKSETVPPGGGGALVAAAPLRTLFRAFVFLPPTFWWGKASPEFRVLAIHSVPNPFFLCTRPCLAELLWESRGNQGLKVPIETGSD